MPDNKSDWQEKIRELACRWLLQTNSPASLPENCIFFLGNPDLFRPSVLKGVLKNIERRGTFFTGTYKNREICYVTPKLGAPAVSIYLEVIRQSSVKNVIAAGFTGGLDASHGVGDFFLPTTAVGLDGTTISYYSSSDTHSPTSSIQAMLQSQLEKNDFLFHSGPIVSIDTLTVETSEMIESFREKDFKAVDMETGFFVTFCSRAHLNNGVMHIITDNASTHEIDPGGKVRNSFHHLIRVVMDTFCTI